MDAAVLCSEIRQRRANCEVGRHAGRARAPLHKLMMQSSRRWCFTDVLGSGEHLAQVACAMKKLS